MAWKKDRKRITPLPAPSLNYICNKAKLSKHVLPRLQTMTAEFRQREDLPEVYLTVSQHPLYR